MDHIGDFNEILDDSEKLGGKHKTRTVMEDFGKTLLDLALANLKPDNGWFTWTNNRRGEWLVRERLDRFVMSHGWLRKIPSYPRMCFDRPI